ncbi:MAG: acylneuraminate cytidylyltransferase family protein [Bacteroidota bacterium]
MMTALVPMKEHSERIPGKNLKLFHGKPLYHTIINVLLACKSISSIIVNTDSSNIINDIKKNFTNIIIHNRPSFLCGDYVSMNSIIEYDISLLPNCRHFIQTHSTNPLIKPETLDKAIKYYFENQGELDSIFSVSKIQTRLYWGNGIPINHDPTTLIRTQDLPIIYEENSCFYIFNRDSFFLANKKRICLRPKLYPIDKLEAIDIDEETDFILAQSIYK